MIRITDPQLLDIFMKMEWSHLTAPRDIERARSDVMNDHENSLGYAIRHFEEKLEKYISYEKEMGDEPDMSRSLGFVIYGNGGMHRYYVRANGSVCFSPSHSNEKFTQQASELGFEIYN